MTWSRHTWSAPMTLGLLAVLGTTTMAASANAADEIKAPPLLSPLTVSPAQAAQEQGSHAEVRFRYMDESFSGGSATNDADNITVDMTQPVIEVAAAAALGPVHVGLTASTSKLYIKSTSTIVINGTTADSDIGSNGTLLSASPFIAAAITPQISVGASYTYVDFRDKATIAGGGDNNKTWRYQGVFGVMATLPEFNLGLAYQTRARRDDEPPAILLHGDHLFRNGLRFGLQLTYRFNKDVNTDTPPANALDAIATLQIPVGSHGSELLVYGGYLPETIVSDPDRYSVGRLIGFGYRLGIELTLSLPQAWGLGLGICYDNVGAKTSENLTGTAIDLTARLSRPI